MNTPQAADISVRAMSQHAPLQVAIERQLREFGYEICGDEDQTGWYWRLDGYDSRSVRLAEDTIEDATLAALQDLFGRTQELQAASEEVLANWESGDLAAAVRELSACVSAMRVGSDADQVAGEAESVVLAGDGVPIGRVAWLVHGDAADGPWLDEAHLDFEAAIAKCRDVVLEWAAEGLVVDVDAMEATVRATRSYTPCDEFTVRLTQIDVIGDASPASA